MGIIVDAHHPATLRAQYLHGHQPDKSQARYHDSFTERRLGQAQALEADRTQHGKDGRFIFDVVGDACAQILWHAHNSGMAAIGNYPIARLKLGNSFASLDHDTHVAVAQCQWLVKLAANRVYRGH